MSRPALILVCAALLSACVSTTPQGQKVRVTNNPDVVKPCQFLGNVKATSSFHSAAEGLAESNTEKTLQNKTASLGGNVLFVVASGIHASGEAYRCASPSPTPTPSQ
jgi:Domain of unknown function (DUF4156)